MFVHAQHEAAALEMASGHLLHDQLQQKHLIGNSRVIGDILSSLCQQINNTNNNE